jgi:hypothetical protein
MSQIDPELPFEIGRVNGRKARESGRSRNATVAPTTDIRHGSTIVVLTIAMSLLRYIS